MIINYNYLAQPKKKAAKMTTMIGYFKKKAEKPNFVEETTCCRSFKNQTRCSVGNDARRDQTRATTHVLDQEENRVLCLI